MNTCSAMKTGDFMTQHQKALERVSFTYFIFSFNLVEGDKKLMISR